MILLDMTMSLDGFIAGPNGEDRGLHHWWFSPAEGDRQVITDLIRNTGAVIMGRRTYDLGAEQDGFLDNPFDVEHFVLSHDRPEKPAKGETSFTFVSDGIYAAVRMAKSVAGDRDIVVAGGADVAGQCLAAGLIDEMRIALAPVLIGEGIRLFDPIAAGRSSLEKVSVIDSPMITHLRFRLQK
ncbi:dihydrofolate reductase family protein [Acrocarpospora pleiomorpha]|nr:dihydrofolate reductase family protein [Acrocarpospora pleiomorpha]